MKKLIISGEDSYIDKLKKHLAKEHPSTRDKMHIEDIKQEIKKKTFGSNLKDSFRNVAESTKKTLHPIDETMKRIDDNMKKAIGDFSF